MTLERDAEFADVYARASLRVADGAPLVWLARLSGTRLPERVAGVDLATALLDAAEEQGLSVYFLGGPPDVLQVAVVNTRERWPRLHLAGAAAPMIDLEHCTADEDAVIEEIARTRPHLLFLFLGAPKQEKWYWRNAARLRRPGRHSGSVVRSRSWPARSSAHHSGPRRGVWNGVGGCSKIRSVWCTATWSATLAFVGIAARQIVGRWA